MSSEVPIHHTISQPCARVRRLELCAISSYTHDRLIQAVYTNFLTRISRIDLFVIRSSKSIVFRFRMRNYWPLFLVLAGIARTQNSNTVPAAQKPSEAVSPSTKPFEEGINAQDYGQKPATCKTTTTVYDYGRPSISTIRITVTAPMTCPSPSTSIRTVTNTITPSRGYEVLPSPITVTVTKTTSVTNGGGYGPPAKTVTITSIQSCSTRFPVTITETKNSTTTKVHLITLSFRGAR